MFRNWFLRILYIHFVHGYWKPFSTSPSTEIWPNGVVPYEISTEFTSNQREKILSAIRDIHRFSCVRFYPREQGSTLSDDYVFFTPGERRKCSSHVGRMGIGLQTLQLAAHCFHRSTLLHELMHALGFHHEHARRDRDSYIRILWHNVHPNYTGHFKIHHMAEHNYGTPYDYASVMHYDSNMGSGNGEPTILKRILANNEYLMKILKDKHFIIKRADTLSLMDAIRLNVLYNCDISICANLYPYCHIYEEARACYKIPMYMAMLCKLSCGSKC